jgi:hypothetical protein
MRRLLIGATMLLVLAAPRMASAQAKAGDRELLFNGQLSTFVSPSVGSNSGVFTFGQAILNLGLFTSDTVEVGGGPSVSVQGGAGNTSATIGANGFLRKYFVGKIPTRQLFVGVEAYDSDFQNFTDQLFVNGTFGLKNYLSEKAALEFRESFGFNPSHPGDFQILQFTVGITVLFGN